MKEYIMAMETDIDGVDCYIRKGELIRCKDCHWHYGTICRRNNTFLWEDNDFCSMAERKEE